jgi:hypothetical protein
LESMVDRLVDHFFRMKEDEALKQLRNAAYGILFFRVSIQL